MGSGGSGANSFGNAATPSGSGDHGATSGLAGTAAPDPGSTTCAQGEANTSPVTPTVWLVLDGSGRRAAIVTRTIGATVSTTRHYVIDIDEPVDDRLRATALAVGLLWDWYTIAWDAG